MTSPPLTPSNPWTHDRYIQIGRIRYMEALVPKTLIDIDDALLAKAMELTGASTKRAAVNEALRNAEETRNAEMAKLAPGMGGMF